MLEKPFSQVHIAFKTLLFFLHCSNLLGTPVYKEGEKQIPRTTPSSKPFSHLLDPKFPFGYLYRTSETAHFPSTPLPHPQGSYIKEKRQTFKENKVKVNKVSTLNPKT